MVILKKNKLWQSNERNPNINYTNYKDEDVWVVDDNSVLAEKIFNLGILWDPVLDDNGELIDVVDNYVEQRLQQQLDEVKEERHLQISSACHSAIIAGCDVTLSDGTIAHFSLEETDQINLTTAFNAVQSGATLYPYHADGELCKMYSADDIITIGNAATAHKLYHLTYCNHILAWIRRAETVEELESITYGAELPEDLAANMQEVMIDAENL